MENVVLVTGGAGYVGSHTCLGLAEAGFRPVVYDDLSNGHAEFVQWGALERGDIRDGARLDEVFAVHRPIAVMHFAGLIEVGQSVKEPGRFYEVNVGGALAVISAARRAGVEMMVFSSTCATYGEPLGQSLDETHPQEPINPYGRSKLMIEQVLFDLDRHEGFRSAILRYFNAAGADLKGRIGERHNPETHAIPLAIAAALGRRPGFRIHGTDYPTRDGTAVRDYVHVLDLADAHVLALKRLMAGGDTQAFNLGRGDGVTVREIVDAVSRCAKRPFEVEEGPRRAGDAAILVANALKARDRLGWIPRHDTDQIVSSAFAWHVAEGA